jgi:hypothetical protein
VQGTLRIFFFIPKRSYMDGKDKRFTPFVPQKLAESATRFPPLDRFSGGLREAVGGHIPEATPDKKDVIRSASAKPGTPEPSPLLPEEPKGKELSDGPRFTPEDMERAREESYRKGYDAGVDEYHKQRADSERQQQQTVLAALMQIDALAKGAEDAFDALEKDVADTLAAAIRRFYGAVNSSARERASVLCHLLSASADAEIALKRPKGLEIYLHPDDEEAFKALIDATAVWDRMAALKECRILPSRKLERGALEIRWLNGGLAVSPQRIMEAVMASVSEDGEGKAG